MIDCKKASEMMSEGMDRELTFGERFSLKFHVLLCGICRRAGGQMRFIHTASSKFDDRPVHDHDGENCLCPEARERILETLTKRS
jgi:Putative zinc-finger